MIKDIDVSSRDGRFKVTVWASRSDFKTLFEMEFDTDLNKRELVKLITNSLAFMNFDILGGDEKC